MNNWLEDVETILEELRTVALLKSVLHIKHMETESAPVILPAAYVVMAKEERAGKDDANDAFYVTWQVLIRCKEMGGNTGALVVTKQARDLLDGFHVAVGQTPLEYQTTEFFPEEFRPEPAFILTFTASVDMLPTSFHNC